MNKTDSMYFVSSCTHGTMSYSTFHLWNLIPKTDCFFWLISFALLIYILTRTTRVICSSRYCVSVPKGTCEASIIPSRSIPAYVTGMANQPLKDIYPLTFWAICVSANKKHKTLVFFSN